MAKILAVLGSPRKNGNTLRAVNVIKQRLSALDQSIEFKTIHLADLNINMCKGCSICLNASETKCPHKDDIPMLVREMEEADGVIFACPTFVANMTGLMVNAIDRMAYFCHRPAFYNKKALLVSTTGSAGTMQLFMALKTVVSSWGFKVTGKVGIAMKTNAVRDIPERYIPVLDKAAERFLKAVKAPKSASPSIHSLTGFLYNQKKYRYRDHSSYDYSYWQQKGWLEKGCRYYTPVGINAFTYLIAKTIAVFVEKTTKINTFSSSK